MTSPVSHTKRNLLIAALAVAVIGGAAAGGYGLWYILIGPSSPAAVSSNAPLLPSSGSVAEPAAMDGTWTVNTSLGNIDDGSASFVGYRVQEQLVGVGGHTAVGRTTGVTGSFSLKGAIVDTVQITADLTKLASDNTARDGQLHRQAIETDTYPTAMFKTIEPIDLGTLPAEGTSVTVSARGALTIHNVTRTVTIELQATRRGGIIAIAGTMPVIFSEWSIQKPNSFSVISVDDHGIMEFHLLFTHA